MNNEYTDIQQINNTEEIIEKPDLSQLTAYQKVKVACEYILNINKKLDSTNTLPSNDLFNKAKEEFPEQFQTFAKNTFLQYLSNTVKDTESLINCLGKKKGYYLSSTAKTVEELAEFSPDTSTNSEETRAIRRQKESLLYSVLESWLIAQGYQSSDVSSSRALGKWGNPDLAGINAMDNFNGLSLEIVTIEAKTSLENWEQWIFEAVSHRRFANRSYFAFAHPEEAISKIPQDIRYYAELYNIGVLVLSLDNGIFQKLIEGNLQNPLDSEDVEIVEIYSAPYNFVQPKYQIKFCNALRITSIKELYQWGKLPLEG
ncbi:hypothetical protein [Nostoc punctiforme]|uniref:Uncharacterized protein n=1 Tax=Nostoc punctiforme (strain ATCC 29133 / PCC 73102) TaxID=63737 RepID=B2IY02_NOSP7|nr:hypothetical protein [Nostoc punctiforme]ACC83061.1 hypothetical protein Npun_R4705 [Nostoc punctiforme PCC 73102]